jgi:hypothetical protein
VAAAVQKAQNGWPAATTRDALGLKEYTVKLQKGAKKVWLAPGAAKALVEIIEWWDKNIEPVTELGSYNYREIRGYEGTGILSNHSSGTAVDINWSLHPLGASGTVPAEKAAKLVYETTKRGLRWGGTYNRRKDEHHIEVNLEPTKFAALWAALDKARGGLKFIRGHWPLTIGVLVAGGFGIWYALRSDPTGRKSQKQLT